ncbi:hypothetical protein SAMN05421640_1719 [Ekhidna lutea]|uniref:Uncharacterized protein n=1 Tax=Ekhidna lutea TaxID=447679 RepID=A0A239ILD0_EKHLU|nr:hypothetical protein [Ekhidna lutea]SNS94349.1 hypothetical protein SAMN05421640_1719 [Ekhidna lutea]
MGKYPIYAIMALVFIGIIKLLQATAFDAKKYSENRDKSFTSVEARKESPKTGQAEEIFNPSEPESQVSNDTPPPVLDRSENDSTENLETSGDSFANSDETATESTNTTEQTTSANTSLQDLKNYYLAPIIANLPAGQLREDVVIRYYRHSEDDNKVYSLKELGYYIHEKEATETSGLGSNVMYYGNNVPLEDIQIVAFTLLENGIPLKSIEPTRFEWKANAIEIGTDENLSEAPRITEQFVAGFSK